jgi:formylmethanofuran dehydrogenase subunit E|tara:strand:+ start:43989 stop:44312 length:324 start_codon:yes stop_codon:yes gene_type:complete
MKNNNSQFTQITYEELGDYIGKKALVSVSAEWFEIIRGTIEGKKKCSKCNEFLSLDEFNNDKRRQFGKRSQCKSCYQEGSKNTLDKSSSNDYVKEVEQKIEYTLTQL